MLMLLRHCRERCLVLEGEEMAETIARGIMWTRRLCQEGLLPFLALGSFGSRDDCRIGRYTLGLQLSIPLDISAVVWTGTLQG